MSGTTHAAAESGHNFVDDLSLSEWCSQPLKSMMRATENKIELRCYITSIINCSMTTKRFLLVKTESK